MKTKYILHGGYATKKNKENDKFFKEILSIDKKELNILIVLFAKKKEKYNRKGEAIINQFSFNNVDKALTFDIADKKLLEEQIKKADIIYLHGGETLKLLEVLKGFANFSKLIKGKVMTGESAGAYVLSACFYSKSLEGCFEGLKLIPVKTICHYEEKNREKLKNCSADLKELLLEKHKYKVFII